MYESDFGQNGRKQIRLGGDLADYLIPKILAILGNLVSQTKYFMNISDEILFKKNKFEIRNTNHHKKIETSY